MFSAGQQIGPYSLIRRLGKGGFGEVWLAERRSQFFTKKVAVKLPHDEQVDFETVRREAELWEAASGHPNVLPIIDADVYDGQVVIVSEYAEGGSLADKLKVGGRLDAKKAAEMVVGILNGLEYLHSKQIIHRDIKPQNVLLQGDTPRLADFGISRAMQTSTVSSVVVGTDAYMAPEAFEGRRNVQTDIWSVGVVLYQLLKGSLPFPQEHPSERLFAVLTKDFEALPDDAPPDLKRIVHKALAKNPGERFDSAAAMKSELQYVLANLERPALARTEVFHNPAPAAMPPPVRPAPPHLPSGQTGEQKTQTDEPLVQPTQASPGAGQTVHPTRPPQSSVVTRIKSGQAGDATKSIATGVRPVAQQVASFGGRNKTLFYGGATFLALLTGLALVLGATFVFNKFFAPKPYDSGARLIPYLKGGKYGYVDENKKIVIEPKYDRAFPFEGGAATVRLGEKWGFIDKRGDELVPLKYEIVNVPGKGGYSLVRFNGKYGVVDLSGKEIFPAKYDSPILFDEGDLFFVERDGKWGAVDASLREVIPFKYDEAEPFRLGLAWVKLGDKYGFIDEKGREVIPIKYEELCPIPPDIDGNRGNIDLICARRNGKFGYLDKTGKEVVPFKYDKADSFEEGLAFVKNEAAAGRGAEVFLIDGSGKEVARLKPYTAFFPFSQGLARVQTGTGTANTKNGFIDRTGREVVPLKYDEAFAFSRAGLAAVRLGNKWGYIDKTGREAIPLKYDQAYFFIDGLGWVKSGDRAFCIDANGTEYYEPDAPP